MTRRDREEIARINRWIERKHQAAPSRPFGPREMLVECAWAVVAVALGYLWMVGMLCL